MGGWTSEHTERVVIVPRDTLSLPSLYYKMQALVQNLSLASPPWKLGQTTRIPGSLCHALSNDRNLVLDYHAYDDNDDDDDDEDD